MSFPQQDPNGEHTRRLIPRSPSHPDLSQGLPPSTDSNASRSEFADTIDRETDTAILADQSDMPQYTSRDVGDPTQIKKNKQSMADLKLRRLTELNNRLREDLERERIPVSQASKRYEKVPSPLSSDAICDCCVFPHPRPVLLTLCLTASLPTATAPETTWFHPSGVSFPRAKTHTLLNRVAAAVQSCKLFTRIG